MPPANQTWLDKEYILAVLCLSPERGCEELALGVRYCSAFFGFHVKIVESSHFLDSFEWFP